MTPDVLNADTGTGILATALVNDVLNNGIKEIACDAF